MAEFLLTEAIDVDSVNDDNNEANINTAMVSDDEFIDDTPQENNDFYPYFTNVSRSYDDASEILKILTILKLVIILVVMKKKKLMNFLIFKLKLNYLKNLL